MFIKDDKIKRLAITATQQCCIETDIHFNSDTARRLINLFEFVLRKQDLDTRYNCVELFIEQMKNNKNDVIKNSYDNFKEICLIACDSQI